MSYELPTDLHLELLEYLEATSLCNKTVLQQEHHYYLMDSLKHMVKLDKPADMGYIEDILTNFIKVSNSKKGEALVGEGCDTYNKYDDYIFSLISILLSSEHLTLTSLSVLKMKIQDILDEELK